MSTMDVSQEVVYVVLSNSDGTSSAMEVSQEVLYVVLDASGSASALPQTGYAVWFDPASTVDREC